jgi:hypothetical protein
MSYKQINAAIARACGWKSKEETNGVPWLWQRTKSDYTIECSMEPPDYCNDLNAMHEAEKTILHLNDGYKWELSRTECFAVWHATARQRAESFLRTLDKWEDAK